MTSHYTLFAAAVPCATSSQEVWARELMEALERMDYEDWKPEDRELIKEALGLEEDGLDDVWGVPGWDIVNGDFFLHSDEAANTELTALILQAFIIKHIPNHTMSFSWAYTCSSPRPGEFGGGACYISADEIEYFDVVSMVTNYADQKKRKGLVEFESDADITRQKTWFYRIIGTQYQTYTHDRPIAEAAVKVLLAKRYDCSTRDVEVWATDPRESGSA